MTDPRTFRIETLAKMERARVGRTRADEDLRMLLLRRDDVRFRRQEMGEPPIWKPLLRMHAKVLDERARIITESIQMAKDRQARWEQMATSCARMLARIDDVAP